MILYAHLQEPVTFFETLFGSEWQKERKTKELVGDKEREKSATFLDLIMSSIDFKLRLRVAQLTRASVARRRGVKMPGAAEVGLINF